MCGIVGYVGSREASSVILQGLKRLEYRGYDSAGVAVVELNGKTAVRRDVGKLINLETAIPNLCRQSTMTSVSSLRSASVKTDC
jgi:glucosamine--fructose-6-phosphate aminotransferase (isomerizing)